MLFKAFWEIKPKLEIYDKLSHKIFFIKMFVLSLFFLIGLGLLFIEVFDTSEARKDPKLNLATRLSSLRGKCYMFQPPQQWWSFKWCYQQSIYQYHVDELDGAVSDENLLGQFDEKSSAELAKKTDAEMYSWGGWCQGIGSKTGKQRRTEVHYECCSPELGEGTFIMSVRETRKCEYTIKVCTEHVCPAPDPAQLEEEESEPVYYQSTRKSKKKSPKPRLRPSAAEPYPEPQPPPPLPPPDLFSNRRFQVDMERYKRAMSASEMKQALKDVREMFYHAYDNYMLHGFPYGEVLPISCKGTVFEMCKLPMVTLIDTMDTLAVLGNHTEFERAVWLVADGITDFAFDVNVSVFETNIRVLGGLLSAHMLATSLAEQIFLRRKYSGELLDLAQDIGNRLLPAFETKTGIPYGTVNLISGVPPGEVSIASTAGGGSLSLEFSVLSALTGDSVYGDAAVGAVRGLYHRKSKLHLLGKHIDIHTGRWTESMSGIGSNSDSFYEYLIKMYCMFGEEEFYQMFLTTYGAIEKHNRIGDWYNDVDMYTGAVKRRRFENLMAFWPGMQILVGDTKPAVRTLNAMYKVWRDHGFIPEEYDFVRWELVYGGSSHTYPLRPELIESTLHLYEATKDQSWLWAGKDFLDSLKHAKVACGFATVNVHTLGHEDTMPSFFLAETAKYLYLLFDRDNFIHKKPYIFSTEAHPFLVSDFMPSGKQCNFNGIIQDDSEEEVDLEEEDEDFEAEDSGCEDAKKQPLKHPHKAGLEHPQELPKFEFDRVALWDVQEFIDLQQTPVPDWWEDFSYQSSFEDAKIGIRGQPPSIPANTCLKDPHEVGNGASLLPNAQTFTFDLGALGTFQVAASQTGFVVQSDEDGETMDISLLTKGLFFIKDRAKQEQGATIADRQSNSIYCYVTVSDKHTNRTWSVGDKVEAKWMGLPAWYAGTIVKETPTPAYSVLYFDGVVEDNITPENIRLPSHVRVDHSGLKLKIPCAVAAFGPTRSLQDVEISLSGPVAFPVDNMLLCTEHTNYKLRRKVAVVRRGTCMFEAKTQMAEKNKAMAVIVINTLDDGEVL